MARKIMVQRKDGESPVLTEIPAENEAQLQEIMKDNPELLPVDEFGMSGPLMVVGRETTLPSGALDLLCLTRSGELLLVEFKTGPQNSDFRHVLAQLLDYGSDLWRMSFEEFESTVASRYFSSEHCRDSRLQRKTSLVEAAREFWPDFSEQETALFHDRLTRQLDAGAFSYVVAAQRFTPTMEQTVEYLNAVMPEAQFYAVELVRFATDDISAFESRTVLKPELSSARAGRTASARAGGAGAISEAQFLEQVEDEGYREALRELLDVCRGLGLRIGRGQRGLTIRLPIPDRREPLTIAWLFPPGISGWMGLTDLTLGLSLDVGEATSARFALESYVEKVAELPGVEPAKPDWLSGYRLNPETVVENRHRVTEILTELVQRASGE